ncbi:EamA domain-containing membrane protein RarD [Roseomonas rosea]|jgi:drug/metabolite transporter (DMT)-like permease|uniref:EamA domain-containing membrane protein RarD n=1 Tax=Muricoccus roseus TaxID=198092 RepID=A0A1M6IQA0_9PROT|nr:DMT family transporter [Roseomonas rosea]SHJ36612.1 EamA domain-containing membrane protein RarD [Roseomonas rosea]
MPLRHDMRRGALLMVGATAAFALMGVFVKTLSARYNFLELMFFRNAFSLPIVLAAGLRAGALLRTRRFGGHVVRATSGLLGMGCAFFALTLLPLAEQTALNYTQPLFIILLAIPWLGERPGPARWAAVMVGFAGVVVIAAGQGAGGAGLSSAVILGCAVGALGGFFGALSTMLVRQLSATEASTTIVLWQALLMAAMTGLFLPFVWVTPSWGDLGLLVVMGLIGGVGQVLNTEAFASAQVSSLGPYTYTGLLWAGLLGWIVWDEAPGFAMLLGSALIIGAGILVLRSEFRGRTK